MKTGILKKDWIEKRSSRSIRFAVAWRIMDDQGRDMVQPWFDTKGEAREYARRQGILLKEEVCASR